jgi:hypothetical protein
MVCDECSLRTTCQLLLQYNQNEKWVNEGNVKEMHDLYSLLELHEAYVSEMRIDILAKLNKMTS